MKDRNTGNPNPAQDESREERYTIPHEVSCSAEFPKGCVSGH